MARDGKGSVLNGYELLQDFKQAGQSMWTFARKDDDEFFLKRFLEPIYPISSFTPGSDETKELQRQQCIEFENHHRAIMKALEGKSKKGGSLIITLDFFREKNKILQSNC